MSKLIEIRSFSLENQPAPEPKINNLALANGPDNVVKQFNLTMPIGQIKVNMSFDPEDIEFVCSR